jgi:hypothetical protein
VVLEGLKSRLSDRRGIAAYLKSYNDGRRALASGSLQRRAKIENRLSALARDLDRAIGLAVKGILAEREAEEQIGGLEKERAELEREIGALGETPKLIELHPASITEYHATVAKLERRSRPIRPMNILRCSRSGRSSSA